MQTNKQPEGDVVVTTTEEGYIVCVTRQDEEGRVISVIAEGKIPREREDTKLIEKMIKALKSCREDMSGTRFKSKTYDDTLVNAALKLARKRLEKLSTTDMVAHERQTYQSLYEVCSSLR